MSDSIEEDVLPPPAVSMRVRNLQSHGGNNAFHNFYNDYSHIPDANLRRRLALSEIDKVPFGLYHVRAVLVAGAGFLLDSYDIFAINLITSLLGLVFWSGGHAKDGYGGNHGLIPDSINQALKASTSAGIVLGMVVFGCLADAFGRRPSPSPSISAAGLLIFWRVMMGIGIGGDYPLSSVITSEFAPTRWRGAMMAAVFSMQGFGQLFAALAALLTTVAFKGTYINVPNEALCGEACRAAADRSWRIIVGVGAIPACFALYYRITIPETPRYTFDVQNDVEKADADIRAYVSSSRTSAAVAEFEERAKRKTRTTISDHTLDVPGASWADISQYFKKWKNLKVLLGTTLSWFFLDLAYYGLGLNKTMVLQAIGYAKGNNMYSKLFNQAVGMLILACAGSIPGYITSILTIDTIGRKPLQVIGFLLLTILFCILGFKLHDLSETAVLVLFVICQFLFNAGPNTTTFIVPGECYPTRYRSTGHGISAAMGKIGAIVAQVISIPLLSRDSPADCQGNNCSPHLDRLLQLFALFMLLGTLTSLLIPESKGLTLEELSGETRTSYNAGCNGSIHLDSPRLRPWNPFRGGRPAGFFYAKSNDHTTGWTQSHKRRSGTGMNSSPEMSQTTSGQSKSALRNWRRKCRRKLCLSNGTDEIALRDRQAFSFNEHPNHSDEITLTDGFVLPGSRHQQVQGQSHQQSSQQRLSHQGEEELPSWGAGWGRIDRGAPPTSSMQLQDVGSLLKDS